MAGGWREGSTDSHACCSKWNKNTSTALLAWLQWKCGRKTTNQTADKLREGKAPRFAGQSRRPLHAMAPGGPGPGQCRALSNLRPLVSQMQMRPQAHTTVHTCCLHRVRLSPPPSSLPARPRNTSAPQAASPRPQVSHAKVTCSTRFPQGVAASP